MRKKPLVSVIVPAHNEEDTIAHTVNSLLEQSYKNLEIIILDDGSNDRTPEICSNLTALGNIKYIVASQRRSGKSSSLNLGLRLSRGEYVVFMDSDTTLERKAIFNLIKYFEDKNTVAVAGNLRVRNWNKNILTRMQFIEYFISISMGRRFRARIGTLQIVSGAFGAFRKDDVINMGGHDPGPGNDSDLTIKMRKRKKRVAFSAEAACMTNVPVTIKGFVRQRRRWNRNMVKNRIRKHKDAFNIFHRNFSFINMMASMDSLFFSVFLAFAWCIYSGDIMFHFSEKVLIIMVINYFLYTIAKYIQYSLAIALSDRKSEDAKLFLYLPIYVAYKAFLRFVRLYAYTEEILFRKSYEDAFAPQKVRKQMLKF